MVEPFGATRPVTEPPTTIVLTAGRPVASVGCRCAFTPRVTAGEALFATYLATGLEETLTGPLIAFLEIRGARAVTEPLTTVVVAAVLLCAVGCTDGQTRARSVVAVLAGRAAVIATGAVTRALAAEADLPLITAFAQASFEGTLASEIAGTGPVGAAIGACQVVPAAVGRRATLKGSTGQRRTAPRIGADVPFGAAGFETTLIVAITLERVIAGAVVPATSTVKGIATSVVRRTALGIDLVASFRCAAFIVVTNLIGRAAVPLTNDVGALAQKQVCALVFGVVAFATVELDAADIDGVPALSARVFTLLRCAALEREVADLTGIAASVIANPVGALTGAEHAALDVLIGTGSLALAAAAVVITTARGYVAVGSATGPVVTDFGAGTADTVALHGGTIADTLATDLVRSVAGSITEAVATVIIAAVGAVARGHTTSIIAVANPVVAHSAANVAAEDRGAVTQVSVGAGFSRGATVLTTHQVLTFTEE